MKKILSLTLLFALTTSISMAGTLNTIKNSVKADAKSIAASVKSDAKATATSVKKAAKTDIQNKMTEKTAKANEDKKTKLSEIETKITDLNKKLSTVKSDKNITETERTLKTKVLNEQIKALEKQKALLK